MEEKKKEIKKEKSKLERFKEGFNKPLGIKGRKKFTGWKEKLWRMSGMV